MFTYVEATEMPQDKLDELIEKINDAAQSQIEYEQSTDSGNAEYTQSFGYGDGELDIDRLENNVRAQVELLETLCASTKEFKDRLADCCDLSMEGIYCIPNEIYSNSIGEAEFQLEESLEDEIKALSQAEFDRLKNKVDCTIRRSSHSVYLYICLDYDRWVMSVDEDKLTQAIKDMSE